MTTPPQYSPDGQWWWDGTQWVPAAQAPQAPVPPIVPQEPVAPAYPQQPYPAYQPVPAQKSDGKAVGSLIASVLWVCGLGSVVGVVLGHVSRGQAKRQGREPSGLAMAGLVLGYLGLVGTIAITLVVVAFRDPIVHTAKRDAELQSASEAQQSFHRATGHYSTSVEELRAYGYDDFDGKVDVVVIRATATDYCMTTRLLGHDFYVSDRSPMPSNVSCR
jgi:hypothetical protein